MICLSLTIIILTMPRTRNQTQAGSNPPQVKKQKQKKKKGIKKAKIQRISKEVLRERIQQKLIHRQTNSSLKSQKIKFQELEQLITEDLNCPICLQKLICPTLTQCGHIFCLSCVQDSLKHKDTCSICRTDISLQNLKPQKMLSQMLQYRLKKIGNNETLQNYNTRMKQFQQAQNKRKIQTKLKVGDYIDFWSKRAWKVGEVRDLSTDKKGNTTVKVTPACPNHQNEVLQFPLNSRLLANYQSLAKGQNHALISSFTRVFRNYEAGYMPIVVEHPLRLQPRRNYGQIIRQHYQQSGPHRYPHRYQPLPQIQQLVQYQNPLGQEQQASRQRFMQLDSPLSSISYSFFDPVNILQFNLGLDEAHSFASMVYSQEMIEYQ